MTIHHTFDGHKGAFCITTTDAPDGKRLAEMTYVTAGESTIIIDHTEVDGSLKGKGIGRQLLNAAVEHVRVNNLRILPLCPFAKSVFDKDPSIRDVLVGA
ncbi:MAG: N-acetyltransferase [Candidatus Kapabacteria bacterium]|nr:N-acetyltransferase [Candidatus Kapabacteria bacterium]